MPSTTRSKRRRMESGTDPGSAPPATRPRHNAASTSASASASTSTVKQEEPGPSDLDFAFQLQMSEAIAASALLTEHADYGLIDAEMLRMRQNFELQSHDRKVASEISQIPENEWQATGDDYHRPYTPKTSAATGGGNPGLRNWFSLYCKGVVVDLHGKKLGAIGVSIVDYHTNAVVFEASKALVLPEAEMDDRAAEVEAFAQGLEFAFSLELKKLVYSLDLNVDNYHNENEKSEKPRVAELAHRIGLLRGSFEQCYATAATNNNAEFVLGLARSSIAKQAGKLVDEIFIMKEQCPICLEDVESTKIFEIRSCHHRFCSSCMRKHIEIKVGGKELPKCPQPDCGIAMDIDSCRKFLAPKMYGVMDQLVKESSIPAAEKVYCPNKNCSYLMSRAEALSNTKHGSTSCLKCRVLFCLDCKVLWHSTMSCDEYRNRRLDPRSADDNLQQLAGNKKWRQCPKCSHMVELAQGCNHIYCRCKHEFCYVCGLEWKNKKPTCTCQLWAEENIICQ